MKLFAIAASAAVLGGAALAAGMQTQSTSTASPTPASDMTVVRGPSAVKWGPGSPAFPPGMKMAVMSGDPAGTGFISIRSRVPAGYKVPPHFHPTDEHVTVLSGTMAFGMGDAMDPKSEKIAGPGGYFVAQAQMHHYAVAKTAATIQIDLNGPFGITYVNPADDPRNKK
jgi:quercetin dioxygenase-like cupin family protein